MVTSQILSNYNACLWLLTSRVKELYPNAIFMGVTGSGRFHRIVCPRTRDFLKVFSAGHTVSTSYMILVCEGESTQQLMEFDKKHGWQWSNADEDE